MKTLRTLHIGVGGRGRWPLSILRDDVRFESAGFVDVIAANLEAASKDFPGIPTFADPAEALAAVQPDVAIICTPTRTHAPLSRQCFERGVHVLVEKGMTMSYDEAVALVADAQAANVRFAVAQNYRYGSGERAMSAVLTDESSPFHPGKVEIAEYVHHRYRPEPRTLNYPFAMVWDMSCHHVDSLSCWLGPIARVTAHASNPSWSAYEHDADIHGILEYASGCVCQYALTHAATYSDCRVILQGPRGAVRLKGDHVDFYPRPSAFLGGSEPVSSPSVSGAASEAGVVDAFYRFVVDGVEPGISGRRNLDTLAVCELLVRSATQRRTVEAYELTAS